MSNISHRRNGRGPRNMHVGYGRCNEVTVSSESSEGGISIKNRPRNEVLLCKSLLSVAMRNPNAKAFLWPVDWKGLNLESYPKVIKRQMDLHTVLSKLEKGYYKSSDEIDQDVSLIWANAMTFNRDGSEYFVAAKRMNSIMEKRAS